MLFLSAGSKVAMAGTHLARRAIFGHRAILSTTTSRCFNLSSQSKGAVAAASLQAVGGHESDRKPASAYTINGTMQHPSKQMEDNYPYWQKIKRYETIGEKEFCSYSFQKRGKIQRPEKLMAFLDEVLPEKIPVPLGLEHIANKAGFIEDVVAGMEAAPMSVSLPPQVLAVIDWRNPYYDPIFRQYIPMKVKALRNHPSTYLSLDSLHEKDDTPVGADGPVHGLVHRYATKVLFLTTSVCPLYCRFCTRSYAVGADTDSVAKESQKPTRKRWQAVYEYLANTKQVNDVVVSGGDCYMLTPEQIRGIGDSLIAMPNITTFRFATKGLVAMPGRILDEEDTWTDEVIRIAHEAKLANKDFAIHTHFNHPNEITHITRKAMFKLFINNVTVRNQSVLLRGVNDDLATQITLTRELAKLKVRPLYVYQGDMVPGAEDLRTPLSTILQLEKQVRGTIGSMNMPHYIIDLPGGGGKRGVHSYESYDRSTGESTWKAPALAGRNGRTEHQVYTYYDPVSVENWVKPVTLGELRGHHSLKRFVKADRTEMAAGMSQ